MSMLITTIALIINKMTTQDKRKMSLKSYQLKRS